MNCNTAPCTSKQPKRQCKVRNTAGKVAGHNPTTADDATSHDNTSAAEPRY